MPDRASDDNRAAFKVALIHPSARVPERAHGRAAGYDLHAAEAAVVAPGGRACIRLGLSLQMPDDCYGRIAPRSGLALRNGIDVLAGVIDSDFRGELTVILQNNGDAPFNVNIGDRCAQLIFERIYTPVLERVSYESLTETERGGGGLGSTGV
jgi:dUTP pyrophosphatase